MASLLVNFWNGFRNILPHAYLNIPQSNHHESDTEDINTKAAEVDSTTFRNRNGISRFHAIFLYTLSLLLAVALASTMLGKAADCDGPLGSYERGFETEIRPDRNTLALKRVKFYGGFVYDENGTASLTQPPGPDYFGIPGRETDHYWNLDLKDRFIAVPPKDWPSEAVEFLEKDLVHGTIRLETNGLHSLHCLNYIRMSLSPEWYFGPVRDPNPQRPLDMHLKHCLMQIHQLLMCQLDMTPIPRTLRPTKHIHHADTDMWHVCRDFSALRNWMYPLEEHHT
ncbi:uncharacterized protein EAF02_007139 [Botrytis sinoallii]|uniref:uncharacterized protein n=1 Tax=Botrytis sinoallii TaxID=1463999 RepID=UPI001902BFF8|nr:uncharacterized protein EAF02_007139 [Botrytis sinoallii]KAF7880293.1 hypothetical protein EAF02_007139 [Botrytis sinoallii]